MSDCNPNSITEGLNGYNAFTYTTAVFTMPVADGVTTGVINVSSDRPDSGYFVQPGQMIMVAGNYLRVTTSTENTITVVNPQTTELYLSNDPAGTLLPINSKVTPTGEQGPPAVFPRRSIIINTSDWDIPPGSISITSPGLLPIVEGVIDNLTEIGDVLDLNIGLQISGTWTGGQYRLVLNGTTIAGISDDIPNCSFINKVQMQKVSTTSVAVLSEIIVTSGVATTATNATLQDTTFNFYRVISQVNVTDTSNLNIDVLVDAGGSLGVSVQYFTAKFTPYDN